MKNDYRIDELTNWLQQQFPGQRITVQPLAGDASFRRYFRVQENDNVYVAMDAPPDNEDCRPFVQVAATLAKRGVRVPHIHAQDLERGFLLLDDFGDTLLQHALTPAQAGDLYTTAIDALVNWQEHGLSELPRFDAAFAYQEIERFYEWFLIKHCQLSLSDQDDAILKDAFRRLAQGSEEQPQTLIHRDYHSRNLLVLPDQQLGVIDFQDAMIGPVTYDLVSLLRDCYIAWPDDQVRAWALYYFDEASRRQIVPHIDAETFLRWFDWQGVQRHLKAIGTFARLFHRDNKPGYLPDIPRTLNYVLAISAKYPELHAFGDWLDAKIPVGAR